MRGDDDRAVRRASTRVFWLTFLGAFLLQVAWVVALPTFRGSDEFDHVYKFDAVTHGQLRGEGEVADSRGQLLAVRPGVVGAAGPMCASYEYTGPANCRPAGAVHGDRVQVASGAASYNPAYYVLAGSLVRGLDGHAYDVGLRLVTSAVVALLVAAAATTAAQRARTAWPLLALAVSVTPTMAMSGAVAAPNGVGYAAGVLWWVSALAVTDGRRPPWGRLTIASVLLVCTHTLNVMWLALMVLLVLALRPTTWWLGRLRADRRAMTAVAAVVAAGLACAGWILTADTNALSESQYPSFPVGEVLPAQVVWSVQTIAIGPMRDQPQDAVVYAMWAAVLLPLLALGLRRADRRRRIVLLCLAATWVVVPLALTAISYGSEGLAWQGRYALPLVVGLALVVGDGLDRSAPPRQSLLRVAALLLGAAHVWTVGATTVSQSGLGLSLALADVAPLPVAVSAATGAAVVGILTIVAVTRSPRGAPVAPVPVSTS